MNSKRKGKVGELELANKLKEYGYECRRSQQYCGINSDADIVGLDGIHIECKRVENLNMNKSMEQAVQDAKDGMPTVFSRKNGKGWLVTMRLEDWIILYKKSIKNDEKGGNVE